MFSRLYVTAPSLPPLQLLKTAALGTGTNLKPVRKMKPHKLHKLQKPYPGKQKNKLRCQKILLSSPIFLFLGNQRKCLTKVHLLPLSSSLWFVSISRGWCPTGTGRCLRSLLVPLVGRWGEPGPKQALSKPALAPHTQVEIPSPWLDLGLGRRVSLWSLSLTGNVILMTDPDNLQIVWYAP